MKILVLVGLISVQQMSLVLNCNLFTSHVDIWIKILMIKIELAVSSFSRCWPAHTCAGLKPSSIPLTIGPTETHLLHLKGPNHSPHCAHFPAPIIVPIMSYQPTLDQADEVTWTHHDWIYLVYICIMSIMYTMCIGLISVQQIRFVLTCTVTLPPYVYINS